VSLELSAEMSQPAGGGWGGGVMVVVSSLSSTGGQYCNLWQSRPQDKVHLGLASVVTQVTTHNFCNGLTLL
jgi:hypothetical protein